MRRVSLILFVCILPFTSLADDIEFSAYPVESVYRGRLKTPDFLIRDKGFAAFKTRILNGMTAGPNYAGEYSIIQFGCGTGCSSVIVGNNRTGELFDFPRGGENNEALTLSFQVNSKLVVARWYSDSLWETCIFETLVFENAKWIAKSAIAAKSEATCEGDPIEGLVKAKGL